MSLLLLMFLQANLGVSAAVLGDTAVGSVPAIVGGPSVLFFSIFLGKN